MVTIATKITKVSDLDGSEDADYGVVVRNYPGIDQAKLLDVTQAQANELAAQAVKNTVVVEIRNPDGTAREIQVPKSEFDKWANGSGEALLKQASNLRGRRPGYSPGGDGA